MCPRRTVSPPSASAGNERHLVRDPPAAGTSRLAILAPRSPPSPDLPYKPSHGARGGVLACRPGQPPSTPAFDHPVRGAGRPSLPSAPPLPRLLRSARRSGVKPPRFDSSLRTPQSLRALLPEVRYLTCATAANTKATMTSTQTRPMPQVIAGDIPFIMDHLVLLTAQEVANSLMVRGRPGPQAHQFLTHRHRDLGPP